MIGPSVRSKLRLRAATSSVREVSGSGAADTFTASAFSAVMTRAQLDPSAHAPWASTTFISLIAIVPLPKSEGCPLHNQLSNILQVMTKEAYLVNYRLTGYAIGTFACLEGDQSCSTDCLQFLSPTHSASIF